MPIILQSLEVQGFSNAYHYVQTDELFRGIRFMRAFERSSL